MAYIYPINHRKSIIYLTFLTLEHLVGYTTFEVLRNVPRSNAATGLEIPSDNAASHLASLSRSARKSSFAQERGVEVTGGYGMATNWNQRFFASTRGRIITLLRRASRTVDELAQVLGLTDNAVRAHLNTLERDGFVQQRGARRGNSKPSYVY